MNVLISIGRRTTRSSSIRSSSSRHLSISIIESDPVVLVIATPPVAPQPGLPHPDHVKTRQKPQRESFNVQGVQKKRTFRIIILQTDTSKRSPEAAWSLQARLVGLDGLYDSNDDSKGAFFGTPWSDIEFVQNFTPLDFQVKNFTPTISPNFNSFSNKKHKKIVKMEKFIPLATNFTLPLALTGWTNSTSDPVYM